MMVDLVIGNAGLYSTTPEVMSSTVEPVYNGHHWGIIEGVVLSLGFFPLVASKLSIVTEQAVYSWLKHKR